jgi:putative hydrolase of the HAD superfamily
LEKQFQDIQAISLDAMGTILELKGNPQEIYGEILRDLGHDPRKVLPLTRETGLFRRYWREAEKRLPPSFLTDHIDRFAHYPQTPYAFWGLVFQVMFADLNLPGEGLFAAVDRAYHRFASPNLWGVEPTLGELAGFCEGRGILLFVTSNWDFRLPKILKDLGIEPFFREIITSASVGFEKPSEKIFHHLIGSAGCAAPQILHVGDKIEDDVRGAKGAGLQAALYRKGYPPAEDDLPFAQVRSLKQIRELLDL